MSDAAPAGLRLAVDIGGTFTDLVLVDQLSGELYVGKLLTTPDDPARGVLDGVQKLLIEAGAEPNRVHGVIHGTTLVTNALIERKGALTALLTTAGFRDTLALGRELRYDLYDLRAGFPEPLVPSELRYDVGERIDASGGVVTPLDEQAVRDAARSARDTGAEAIAVTFLHSYMNQTHEERAAAILREEFGYEFVSVSHVVAPILREFERSTTTVANAYVQPLTARYLDWKRYAVSTRDSPRSRRSTTGAGGG